jgi:ligand-binding sensor domain-containing protein
MLVRCVIASVLACLLADPVGAGGTTLGRMSFWVAPAKVSEFAQAHQRLVLPLVAEHGFVVSSEPSRATPDSVVSYLYVFASPTALETARKALVGDPRWDDARQGLAESLGAGPDSLRYEFTLYWCPAGPGQATAAGGGQRRGLWVHYNVHDGLPGSGAAVMRVDADGALWFTLPFGGGLARFDGASFTRYMTVDGLQNDSVRSLLLDGDGHLWIGTEIGLCHFDGQTFTAFTAADGLQEGWITTIEQTADGGLFLGGPGGFSHYNGGRFHQASSLRGRSVASLVVDHDGRLWGVLADPDGASAGSTVYRWQDGEPLRVGATEGLEVDDVRSISQGCDEAMWFGGNGRVTRYDGERSMSLAVAQGLAPGPVWTMECDGDGNMWFGSSHSGLSRWDGERVTTFSTAQGMANSQVLGLVAGAGGTLWVGTMGGGLSRYDGTRISHFTHKDGLPTTYIFAGLETHDGQLWFGTAWGLVQYDGHRFQTFRSDDGLTHNRVWDLRQDGAGHLWLLHDGEDEMTRLDDSGFTSVSLGSYVVGQGAMAIGPGSQVWQTNGEVLNRFDGDSFRPVALEGLPEDAYFSCLSVDREGQLWLGTRAHGIWRTDGSITMRAEVPGPHTMAVTFLGEDRDGRMWAGYSGGQIAQVNSDSPILYSPETGTRLGFVFRIATDRRGHLWIASYGAGVVRFDGLVFQYLSTRDGLINDSVQDLLEDSNGNIWIGTDGGLTRYRPSTKPPSIHLVRLTSDRPYEPMGEWSLPASQDLIRLEFQGRSLLTPPGAMAYVYRLVGQHDTWQATRQTSVSYQDLPTGEYVFEVKAVDGDLNYSQPATVRIRVTPAYGQLALMAALVLSLSGAAVAGTYAIRRRRERDVARVQLVEERRQRIEVQPHDIESWSLDDFVGSSSAMQRLRARIRALQQDDANVLITGEAGTGKELTARAIHAGSQRSQGRFVAVRCAGLPADVTSIEVRTAVLSALLGHVRGAFPGADTDRVGLLQQAHGGTLFLDEIGVLPLPLQAHLLRVLLRGEVVPTGTAEGEAIDLRVIASSSEDLAAQVEAGALHPEFHEFLAAHTLIVTPLRERPEDIAPLAQQIMDALEGDPGRDTQRLGDDVLHALRGGRLSGNARELRRVLEQAVRGAGARSLQPQDLDLLS